MTLLQLRYFVTLAELGNFTKTALAEGIVQPTLSDQIARLESAEHGVGTALFVRNPRGCTLTPAGAALLPHARAALDAVAKGRLAAAALKN